MKIKKNIKGEFGNFQIFETLDRKIRRKFIDLETKLLIIMEQDGTPENGYTGSSHFITIDPETGEIIDLENRKNYIDYSTINEIDEKLGIKWSRKRNEWSNGNEYFEFNIYAKDTTEPIVLKYWTAFSDKPQKAISESYLEHLEAKENRKKEIAEYQKKSYEEKVKFWSGTLHRQMRWNGESGYDEYSIFSKKWLNETREFEPLIEKIIDDVIEKYWKNYWDVDKIRKALKS